MDATDRELAKVVCLVEAGVDEAAVAALELHFAPGVEVVSESRRRERRGAERRRRDLGFASARDRRRVQNRGGRRIDDRRRVLMERPSLPLPPSLSGLGEGIGFVAPRAGDRRRLEAAESLRLVVRFQLGDGDAFKTLYERHFDGVYGYLLTALRDRNDAEDGAQEVFIRVLRALPRYEFFGTPFEAWLFRIVRNHTLNVKQRSAPVSPADPSRIDLLRDHRERRALTNRDASTADRDLLVLVERLPPSQRQVLVLRYMVGLDWTDIATVLGRSSGAVRQLEQRALTYLRKRLGASDRDATARTRSLPMQRRAWPSPVATSRRGALLEGARVA